MQVNMADTIWHGKAMQHAMQVKQGMQKMVKTATLEKREAGRAPKIENLEKSESVTE
jgi:hypothetical protein